jgi:hypothetical protein
MTPTTSILHLSPAANAHALECLKQQRSNSTTYSLGFRFESDGATHRFELLKSVNTGDHILQPIQGGVVVFCSPSTLKKAYGTDIDWNATTGWTFLLHQRQPPAPKEKVPSKRKALPPQDKKPTVAKKKKQKENEALAILDSLAAIDENDVNQ